MNNRIFFRDNKGKHESDKLDIYAYTPIAYNMIQEDNETDWLIDQFNHMDPYDLETKIQQSIEISKNLERIILYPNIKGALYTEEELDDMYDQYNKLSIRNKILSDQISFSIWGYSTDNIYKMGKNRFSNVKDPTITDDMAPMSNLIREAVMEGDPNTQITYAKGKSIFTMDDLKPYIEYISTRFDVEESAVPFFTVDDMYHLEDFGHHISIEEIDSLIENNNYYSTAKKYQEAYANGNQFYYEKCISIGWHPDVKVTLENMNRARKKQSDYFNERACSIIDIRNYLTISENVIAESSSYMKGLYKKNNLYPIYIIVGWYGSIPGHLIRWTQGGLYSHAGLCMDSDMKTIYTYKMSKKYKVNGFGVESLNSYIDDYKDCLVNIMVIFVDKETKDQLEKVLDYYKTNQPKSTYSIPNMFNILFRRKKTTAPESLSLVCSQFVDLALKMVNCDITHQVSNLVQPKTFDIMSKTNPKVYKVYEGFGREYKEEMVESYIKALMREKVREELIYKDKIQLDESMIEELLPKALIFERKLPVKFNVDGDLTISMYKSLEEEYQDAHKLLTSYSSENIDGIKHELARLFYINSVLEKKIKNMKYDDENYKKSVDLRARVLNDFKKYFKVIAKSEPQFDFSSYFESTEYSGLTIDKQTLNFAGKAFAMFLQSVGL